MENYWRYFKQGWWAQLVMFIFQLVLIMAAVPIALLFHENKTAYYLIVSVVFVFALVPFSGWLFNYFSTKFAGPG